MKDPFKHFFPDIIWYFRRRPHARLKKLVLWRRRRKVERSVILLQGATFCFVEEGECDDQLRAKYQYPGDCFQVAVSRGDSKWFPVTLIRWVPVWNRWKGISGNSCHGTNICWTPTCILMIYTYVAQSMIIQEITMGVNYISIRAGHAPIFADAHH